MKPANTRIKALSSVIPAKPKKGDIRACRAYIQHVAQRSQNPNATRAHIWIGFIHWSYLDEPVKAQPYTGWKQQQRKLQQLKGGKPNVC